MTFEVECKYRVPEHAPLVDALAALGAEIGPPELQVDRYYAHPARDFASTDEALRIRRMGEVNFVTYKGPKLDRTTKTRKEIELPLPPGEAGETGFAALLEALGFSPVREVRKQRRHGTLAWQGQTVVAALDEVTGLGSFIELELTADEAGLEEAKRCIQSLAERLALVEGERRSYLELLLEASAET